MHHVDKRVELPLRDRHFHTPLHGFFLGGHGLAQHDLALLQREFLPDGEPFFNDTAATGNDKKRRI
jgi:hypothetical protein